MPTFSRILGCAVLITVMTSLLVGCTTQTPPSSYDLATDRFRADDPTYCERYAYQSGRNRYEFLQTFNGQGWSGSNANRFAAAAYEHCVARRGAG